MVISRMKLMDKLVGHNGSQDLSPTLLNLLSKVAVCVCCPEHAWGSYMWGCRVREEERVPFGSSRSWMLGSHRMLGGRTCACVRSGLKGT